MEKSLSWREFIITRLIQGSGYSAILFVALIFFFLLREGLPTLREVDISSLLNIRWYPIESYFGILPLITGTLIVTIGATSHRSPIWNWHSCLYLRSCAALDA